MDEADLRALLKQAYEELDTYDRIVTAWVADRLIGYVKLTWPKSAVS